MNILCSLQVLYRKLFYVNTSIYIQENKNPSTFMWPSYSFFSQQDKRASEADRFLFQMLHQSAESPTDRRSGFMWCLKLKCFRWEENSFLQSVQKAWSRAIMLFGFFHIELVVSVIMGSTAHVHVHVHGSMQGGNVNIRKNVLSETFLGFRVIMHRQMD